MCDDGMHVTGNMERGKWGGFESGVVFGQCSPWRKVWGMGVRLG